MLRPRSDAVAEPVDPDTCRAARDPTPASGMSSRLPDARARSGGSWSSCRQCIGRRARAVVVPAEDQARDRVERRACGRPRAASSDDRLLAFADRRRCRLQACESSVNLGDRRDVLTAGDDRHAGKRWRAIWISRRISGQSCENMQLMPMSVVSGWIRSTISSLRRPIAMTVSSNSGVIWNGFSPSPSTMRARRDRPAAGWRPDRPVRSAGSAARSRTRSERGAAAGGS